MSQDRDSRDTRDNINRVAKNYRDLAARAGNPNVTHTQAVERVKEARRKGDRKRENGNR